MVGLKFGALLAGAIITETIFSWPCLGKLVVTVISNRAIPSSRDLCFQSD